MKKSRKNLMFTTDNVGDVMLAAMNPKDAAKWFGAAPPDLTLIARSKRRGLSVCLYARLL